MWQHCWPKALLKPPGSPCEEYQECAGQSCDGICGGLCDADADCLPGQTCNGEPGGYCTNTCDADGDCPSPLVCNPKICGFTQGSCGYPGATCKPYWPGECGSLNDCTDPVTDTCYEWMNQNNAQDSRGLCTDYCSSDADCGTGKCFSFPGASVCLPTCAADADCPAPLLCVAGLCGVIEDNTCSPESLCEAYQEVCHSLPANEQGIWGFCAEWCSTSADCDPGETCGGGGFCVMECALDGDCVPPLICATGGTCGVTPVP